MTIQQQLENGLAHLKANRVGDAIPLFRQVLAQQPQNPDALFLLGIAEHQSG